MKKKLEITTYENGVPRSYIYTYKEEVVRFSIQNFSELWLNFKTSDRWRFNFIKSPIKFYNLFKCLLDTTTDTKIEFYENKYGHIEYMIIDGKQFIIE